VNGIGVGYSVAGGGEPLVMIAGFGVLRRFWLFQTRAFKRHFRVVTLDNRGAGSSDKPRGPYTMRALVDDTVGLMDYLGIGQAHVLGVSMGGMIAQELAISHPERVMRLVLASTFACRSGSSGNTEEYRKALGLGEGYSDDELRRLGPGKLMSAVFSLAFNRWPLRIPAGLLSGLYSKWASAVGAAGQLEATLGHDTLDRLHLIQAPTLVITGTGDRVIRPRSSEVLAGAIPNATLVKVEGGSHTLFLEMRSRFNREVLDFLRGGKRE
jgi:pimeloyl-ACP methyl ester carboxylesterase